MTGNDPSSTADSANDLEGGTRTVRDEWTTAGEPSSAVVRAVADATGTDPMDMQPLYEAVDPDALDRFLTHGPTSDRSLSFRFARCDVTVDAGGRLVVEPLGTG